MPLLLLADVVIGPRLASVIRRLLDSRLVAPSDEPRFEAAVDEIARRRDSRAVE